MKFHPTGDRVAVHPIEEEAKTPAGLIIPDTAKEKPMQGVVVGVGNGLRNQNGQLVGLEVKVGDRVVYGKWSGTEVKLHDKTIVVMKESDIMGILTNDN